MIEKLISDLLEALPGPDHPGGRGYEKALEQYENTIHRYMRLAFAEGVAYGEESEALRHND